LSKGRKDERMVERPVRPCLSIGSNRNKEKKMTDDEQFAKEAKDPEASIEITEIPHGRLLKPTGNIFRLTEKTLQEMTIDEVKAYVVAYRDLCQEAKMVLDQRSTKLTIAEGVLEMKNREENRIARYVQDASGIKMHLSDGKYASWRDKIKAAGVSDQRLWDIMLELARKQSAAKASQEKKDES